jgi:hypothetical protein
MLIDLTFSLKHQTESFNGAVKEVDTSKGLRVVVDVPNHGEIEHTYATRLEEGVGLFAAYSFDYTIKDFTEYEVIHSFEEDRRLFQAIENATTEEDKDKARKLYWNHLEVSDYGSADTLEQILEYGKRFIDSPEPYVISFGLISNDDTGGGWRFHKNGPYIGKHEELGEYLSDSPEIKEIITFHFHKLKLKEVK